MIRESFLMIKKEGVLVVLILLIGVFGVLNPAFISVDNLVNILVQSSATVIIALGMTFVILIGGIDLSVGSIVALSGMVFALLLSNSFSVWVAVGISITVALLIGLINGIAVSIGKIPPFIATLAMMGVARGIALLLSDGRSVSVFGEKLPLSSDFSIAVTVGVVFVLCLLFIKFTAWGNHIYAIGSNKNASRLSGLRVKRYETAVYVICSLLAGVASIILVSRLNSAQPTAGMFYEMDVIAAVVIGGTSLSGGKGSVSKTLWSALLLGVIANGLSIMNISSYVQQIVVGVLLGMAVLVDNVKIFNLLNFFKRDISPSQQI